MKMFVHTLTSTAAVLGVPEENHVSSQAVSYQEVDLFPHISGGTECSQIQFIEFKWGTKDKFSYVVLHYICSRGWVYCRRAI